MTCHEAHPLVHALVDGELDAGHAREVEAHVAGCARCAAELAAAQDLKRAMGQAGLRHPVPAVLRTRIGRALPDARAGTDRRTLLKGFAWGSAASALAAASVALVVLREDRGAQVLGEAVSAHLRSLQADHLADVLSTDQHTVKPWFNGRLDLAPPVSDLTAQGFTLVGGRLDYIAGKPVAAIVYRRRVHVINLFVGEALAPVPSRRFDTVQGFNVLRWSQQGFDLMAVSDLNGDELQEFEMKFSASLPRLGG